MSALDPVELEVLRNALTAAAAEMDVTVWRTSRSTIVREMLDYSTAVFDANGNNVAQSFIQAAARFDFTLRLATPDSLRAPAELVAWARREGARIEETDDPAAAVRGARCVVTDAWVSMNDETGDAGSGPNRHNLLAPYQVTQELMRHAAPDAIFQHCLPAHRGEEVTDAVIDGAQSAVWDEAENRLHVQKAIMLWCLGKIG